MTASISCSRYNDRRDIKISGEDYEYKRIYGKKGLIISVVTCLFLVGLPLAFSKEITADVIIYTIGKLAALLYRMAKGYSEGAKAYHTVEVRHLDSKSDYLEEFVGFVDNKDYMKIANEYTSIYKILGIPNPEEKYEDACIKSHQERAGDGDLGSQPDALADTVGAVAEPRGADRRGDHDGAVCVPS